MASTDTTGELCPYTTYREGEPPAEGLPATGEGATGREAAVWSTLETIEDPEMPVSIVDLGLIYGVAVGEDEARIDMTLTYSGCPARDLLIGEIERAVGALDGIETVDVNLVWYPPWSVANVTPAGRDALESFGLSLHT